jgi:hypothetical protein
LNIKTFFASIIGIITVYLFAFVWAVYNEGIQAFVDLLPHYQDLLVLQSFGLTLQDLLVLSLVAVLFIISGFNIFMSGLSEKIRTGTYLNFLYLISICLAVALVLQSEWKINWTLMIYIPVVFILSHFFTLSIRKITSWTLLFFILFFMGMYVWQVFF